MNGWERISSRGKQGWNTLLDWLFSPKCPFCHHLLDEGEAGFCAACQKSLPWALGEQREQKPENLDGCVSPLFYREGVRSAVHRFKFYGRAEYAKVFAPLMAQCVLDHWRETTFDLVTWAPLSRRRLRKRGYDQAGLLAKEVGRQLGLPVEATLRKCRHTPAQSRQADSTARRENVSGAYAPLPGRTWEGKRILLVDDVVTSGSTLGECARVLRTAGAGEVWAVTLARAGKVKNSGGNL